MEHLFSFASLNGVHLKKVNITFDMTEKRREKIKIRDPSVITSLIY